MATKLSTRSEELWDLAKQSLVAGVSASTRVNSALKRPFYVERGVGSRLYDVDGNELIDMCTSHGGSILGHKHPKIVEAIQKALDLGILCSYETEYQGKLANKVSSMVPGAELMRFTCSGTEATMHAIRVARVVTGKEKIIKFEGHFHGYHDYVQYSWSPPLDQAGPVEAPIPYAQSGGIPAGIRDYIVIVPFNDTQRLEDAIKKHKNEVAAVICEPINYNCGCVVPDRQYMHDMRRLCTESGIMLIYDEILSAFRTGPDCAQGYFGVVPDLCTIGKCVAGGTPLSIFAGKKDYMENVRPLGESEHSGTYTGHLIPVMAAIACLEEISSPGFYDHIYALADTLYGGINELIAKHGLKIRLQGLGARFGLYFGIDEEVTNYRISARNDKDMALKFYKLAYDEGVYFHDYSGKACHHGFSAVHTIDDIEQVLGRLDRVFGRLK